MSTQRLSDYFDGFVIKRLSAVETDQFVSHQHEFNGVKELKNLLGTEKVEFPAQFVFLSEEESENLTASAQLTWYDARTAHPTRSEFRLYFESNPVLDEASAGDLLFIGKTPNEQLFVVIAEANSTAESQLLWLFRLNHSLQDGFSFKEHSQFQQVGIGFVERQLLEQLGITTVIYQGELLNLILNTFGPSFPRTKIFSEFARSLVMDADPVGDPDGTLMRWLDQEEIIFRTLERHIVSEKLTEGFNNNVDDFISYSLGVQNRRKSRAGHAFENHLQHIFVENRILFSRGSTTENNSKPDFIFPGISAYEDSFFASENLTMLAAKTTCKDRWRQVLTEAERIELKHLATLEPGITENQTDEMKANSVQLVVPESLHDSYSPAQRPWLFTLQYFVRHMNTIQSRVGLALTDLYA
jgi:hypothetical protein